jgi:hypothetical protein
MLLHAAAMTISFPIIMVGLRLIVGVESWGVFFLLTLFLILFASFVITLIDYQEMYRRTG